MFFISQISILSLGTKIAFNQFFSVYLKYQHILSIKLITIKIIESHFRQFIIVSDLKSLSSLRARQILRLPSWGPYCKAIPRCSFSFCSCCLPFASFAPSRCSRVACGPASGNLPYSFRFRKSLMYPLAKHRLASSQSSFLQFPWFSFLQLDEPSNLSSVSFVLIVFVSSFPLLPFLFSVDSQCVSTFFNLRVWFVPFGPWWQNQRKRPWRA